MLRNPGEPDLSALPVRNFLRVVIGEFILLFSAAILLQMGTPLLNQPHERSETGISLGPETTWRG